MKKVWGVLLSALFVAAVVAVIFRWGRARAIVTGASAATSS